MRQKNINTKYPYSGQKIHPNSKATYGHELHTNTFNRLFYEAELRTKEQVVDAYIKNNLLRIRNFGRVAYNEVFDWLDNEITEPNKPLRIKEPNKKTPLVLTPEQLNVKTNKLIRQIQDDVDNLKSETEAMTAMFVRLSDLILERIPPYPNERKYTHPTNLQ